MSTRYDYSSNRLVYYNGILVQDVTYDYYTNVSQPLPSRMSVDSGRFQPGDYRVNPYSISSCSTEELEDDEEDFVDREYTRLNRGREERYRQVTTGSYFAPTWQVGWNPTVFPLPSTAAYEQLALQKAKSKVAAADLDLGETLGEYKETIQLLRDPLGQLKKFLLSDRARNWRLLLALAKGDKRQINRLLGRTGKASADTMSSTWLELRYGIRPLVYLIQDVIEMVQRKQKAVFDPSKIRSARSTLSFTEEDSLEYNYLIQSIQFEGDVEVKDLITVHAAIQYRQSDEQSFLDTLGLTPRYLPETVWNLTRLSFVVDWIFSIGPWLGSLRVAPSVDVLGNTVGVRIKRTIHPQYTARYNTPTTVGEGTHCPMPNMEYNSYDRKCNVDISYLPHFTWGRTLDLFKAIDSISLIWQFLPQLTRK